MAISGRRPVLRPQRSEQVTGLTVDTRFEGASWPNSSDSLASSCSRGRPGLMSSTIGHGHSLPFRLDRLFKLTSNKSCKRSASHTFRVDICTLTQIAVMEIRRRMQKLSIGFKNCQDSVKLRSQGSSSNPPRLVVGKTKYQRVQGIS